MKIDLKSKIRVIGLICLVCMFLLVICYRYYKMNFGIPQKFKNEIFTINDQISLDSIKFKINSLKLTYDKNTSIISINLNIQNISEQDVDIYDLIYHSKILYKNIIIEVPCNIENNDKTILEFNSEKNITVNYKLPDETIQNNIRFYPSKKLYKHQIKEYMEKYLLMYEKAIEINFGDLKNEKNIK